MPRGSANLRIAFFTDIHGRVEWGTPDAMQQAAAAISQVKADVVICGGDCITDGFQSSAEAVLPRWDAYMQMHRAITPEPHTVIGNHDLVGAIPEDGSRPAVNPRLEFLHHMKRDRTWITLDAGGCRFFLLDSFDIVGGALKYRGWISPEQINWLRSILRDTDPTMPLVVATHMPFMTGFFQATEGLGTPVPENRGVMNHREVLRLFARHNLVLVLQGHLHVNELLRWRDTTFITGGAVCGKWWRGSWQGTPEGFGVVTLRGSAVDWAYKTYGWEARRPRHL
jgi:predicted phosphodiesterase